MLIKIRAALTCVLLLTLIVLGLYVCGLVRAATVTMASVPGEIRATRAELVAQVAAVRVDALAEIDNQANELRGELHGDVRLLNAQVGAIASRADKQLTTIQTTALMLGGKLDAPLAAVTAATNEIAPLLRASQVAVMHVNSITAQIDDAAPLYLDCDAGNCLYNLVEGTAAATEQTLEVVAKAAPRLAASAEKNGENVAGITADVHTLTTAATKPKSIFGKIWAGIVVASRFAGML